MKKQNNPEINKIPLFDSGGKKQETLELNKDIFNGKFSESLLYQAVRMYRANQRRGTASTKTRANVRGGGKKPWKQKGTGRARAGSIRSPLWRHGGTVFGPHPRDFSYTLPKKIKRKAFVASLNAKLKSGQISAVSAIALDSPKTKNIADLLEKLNMGDKKILLLVKETDKNLILASRNIRKLKLKKFSEATAFDVLSTDQVIMAKDVAQLLEKRDEK